MDLSAPGLKSHAPDTSDCSGEWAVETTIHIRADKGLHTTFFPKRMGTTQASRYVEAAKEHRMPGGRMAWESLAAGAVLLAWRGAVARNIRVQTDADDSGVRDRTVEMVVKELDEAGGTLETGLELAQIAEPLMDIPDAEPVGPGMPRLTVAGAAVRG